MDGADPEEIERGISGSGYRFPVISDQDVEQLKSCAESLPMDRRHDVYDNYVENLFLAVLDLMMKVATVNKALAYYRTNRREDVHDLPTLTMAMERFPDDKEGNTELAQYLWGNNHWTRASTLRRLADYFESIGVIDQVTLVAWAKSADFKRDFEGRVKGLGFAVYQWILMRCEVDTVKPDTHTRGYAEACLGRPLSDSDVVDVIVRTAAKLGIPARSLDVAIWEYRSGNIEPDSREDPEPEPIANLEP